MSPILKNSVHEMSPFENVHEKSPILKNSVHEMSLSTKCLHPQIMAGVAWTGPNSYYDFQPRIRSAGPANSIIEVIITSQVQ